MLLHWNYSFNLLIKGAGDGFVFISLSWVCLDNSPSRISLSKIVRCKAWIFFCGKCLPSWEQESGLDEAFCSVEILLFLSHRVLFRGKKEKSLPPLLGFHKRNLKDFRKKSQAFTLQNRLFGWYERSPYMGNYFIPWHKAWLKSKRSLILIDRIIEYQN